MCTQLFFAFRAVEAFICFCREALGVKTVGQLPSDKESDCTAEEAISIPARNENKRREHHCEIPVIDSAGRAASVFHEPRLERAEEEYANDVADGVADRDEDKYSLVDDSGQVQRSDHGV